MMFAEAVGKATDRGHVLKNDPPANELSRVARQTCTKCGRAVLFSGSHAYGSALESDCVTTRCST